MRQGSPSGVCPGTSVRPNTPTVNVTISTSKGARMRRRTMKIAVDDGPLSSEGSDRGWASDMASVTPERRCLDDEQHHGDDVGEQRPGRQ